MNAKTKKEMNLMPNDDFFAKISEKCNYLSVDLVKTMYNEMLRLTIHELRHNGAIRYPFFGDFYIKYHKEKMVRNVNDGKMVKVPPKKLVKFSVNRKLREYFVSLS